MIKLYWFFRCSINVSNYKKAVLLIYVFKFYLEKLSLSVTKEMSLPHSLTKSRLAITNISPLFVYRFWHSLQFYHLELIVKPFLMVAVVKLPGISDRGGGWILCDFRELSSCGRCGSCLNSKPFSFLNHWNPSPPHPVYFQFS